MLLFLIAFSLVTVQAHSPKASGDKDKKFFQKKDSCLIYSFVHFYWKEYPIEHFWNTLLITYNSVTISIHGTAIPLEFIIYFLIKTVLAVASS